MDIEDVLDAVNTHAAAAAVAVDPGFKNVEVGFPTPSGRGRTVRTFYGGEADAPHIGDSIATNVVAQRVIVRGWWPIAEYGVKRGKALMLELRNFVHELRGRLIGDHTLGGTITELVVNKADVDQDVVGTAVYATVDVEVFCEFDEYAYP